MLVKDLVEFLQKNKIPEHTEIQSRSGVLFGVSTYRGNYNDCAFNYRKSGDNQNPITVGEFLLIIQEKRIFEGYKGGEFIFSPDSELFIAEDNGDNNGEKVTKAIFEAYSSEKYSQPKVILY